jgi:hypothetical protein
MLPQIVHLSLASDLLQSFDLDADVDCPIGPRELKAVAQEI